MGGFLFLCIIIIMEEKTINVRVMLVSYHPVGKTSLMIRYFTDKFVDEWLETSQIYERVETIKLDSGYTIKLIILDTPGSAALENTNLNTIHGIFLIFDVTHTGSFDQVRETIEDLKKRGHDNLILVILGNKADLTTERLISKENAQELANKYSKLTLDTRRRLLRHKCEDRSQREGCVRSDEEE